MGLKVMRSPDSCSMAGSTELPAVRQDERGVVHELRGRVPAG